jgi:hypothetical protein
VAALARVVARRPPRHRPNRAAIKARRPLDRRPDSGIRVRPKPTSSFRKSGPTSEVTKVLNGPSCSGTIVGDDVVKRVVNVGDIIIIPAGTPHGWTEIGDHVDYLSVRPDPQRTIPDLYTNPVLKKQ